MKLNSLEDVLEIIKTRSSMKVSDIEPQLLIADEIVRASFMLNDGSLSYNIARHIIDSGLIMLRSLEEDTFDNAEILITKLFGVFRIADKRNPVKTYMFETDEELVYHLSFMGVTINPKNVPLYVDESIVKVVRYAIEHADLTVQRGMSDIRALDGFDRVMSVVHVNNGIYDIGLLDKLDESGVVVLESHFRPSTDPHMIFASNIFAVYLNSDVYIKHLTIANSEPVKVTSPKDVTEYFKGFGLLK